MALGAGTLDGRAAEYPAAARLLAVSVVAPSVSSLHSGVLCLRHLADMPQHWSPLVMAVAVVLGAASFDLTLQPFLGLLGAKLPPVIATMLLRRREHEDWQAWTAWAAGALAAAAAWVLGSDLPVVAGIAVAPGIFLACRSVHVRRLSPGRMSTP